MELNCVNFRSRCWSLTINNYTEKDLTQLHTVFEICDDFACQEEKSKSGTPHIQGYIYFRNDKAESVVRKMIPRGHWEPARKPIALKQYCSKAATRVGRQWRKNLVAQVNSTGKPDIDTFMAKCLLYYKKKYNVEL